MVDLIENPLSTGKPLQMTLDVCVEIKRLETVAEPCLNASEIVLILLYARDQSVKTVYITIFTTLHRPTVLHVKPLNPADG